LKFREHRPCLVVIDDLENDELVASDDRRNKLENWFRFNMMRGLDRDRGKIIMLGTILHEHSLLKKIIDGVEPFQGWGRRIYKAIKDDGTSFWEVRFPILDLIGSRDDPKHPDYMGSLVFAQEMQNEPRGEKDRIIKEAWLKFYHSSYKDDAWLATLKILGGVDPAISESEGSSYFSFTTIGIDKDGQIYLLDIIRGKFTALVQAEKIVECYKKFKHDNIGIESIAYQKVLSQLVKNEGAKQSAYPKIKEIFTDKDKTRRLVAQSAKFEGGFIHLDADHPETENMKKEILAFPAKPNDAIDSLVLALETASKPMARGFSSKPSSW
jgi:predicted phage terminase large subunit-like protein